MKITLIIILIVAFLAAAFIINLALAWVIAMGISVAFGCVVDYKGILILLYTATILWGLAKGNGRKN